jgi:hypothetical protein
MFEAVAYVSLVTSFKNPLFSQNWLTIGWTLHFQINLLSFHLSVMCNSGCRRLMSIVFVSCRLLILFCNYRRMRASDS